MSGWDGRGSTRAWRKLRRAVLARDGYACQIRGPRCIGTATTVDHLDPLALGGPLLADPARLRAACVPCNAAGGQALSTRAHRLGRPSRDWRSTSGDSAVLAVLLVVCALSTLVGFLAGYWITR